MPIAARDFQVQRKNFRDTRFADTKVEAGDGQVVLAVDKFALTANNITYAVFGEAMGYWNFFPAQDPAWGRVPVWGFSHVVESKHPDIKVGERIYGYLPMSTHLVVQPDRVNASQFMDGVAWRRPLPAVYQVYYRLAHDPLHQADREAERALLHPLFFTSWLCADFLADNQLFGAKQVVLASASSKTALGIAFLLHQQGIRTVGLTSPGNKAFCEKVGYYAQVVTYDALETLAPDMPTVYVDMAGDGKLLAKVHNHFKDALKHSCIVGATHWEERATQHAMPGPKPQFFFAPTWIAKRTKDWTFPVLQQRLSDGWAAFLPSVIGWLQVRHGKGPDAVKDIYMEVLEGRQAPALGHMLSF